MKFVERTIEVKTPEKTDKNIPYSDVLIYLVKTVSQIDPKYEYLLGLAFYAKTKGLTPKQTKLADDLIEYFIVKDKDIC